MCLASPLQLVRFTLPVKVGPDQLFNPILRLLLDFPPLVVRRLSREPITIRLGPCSVPIGRACQVPIITSVWRAVGLVACSYSPLAFVEASIEPRHGSIHDSGLLFAQLTKFLFWGRPST